MYTTTLSNTKFLVTAALMTALCCIGTMVIKVPTPTMGYVHIGDGLVLLSGILLGPVYGSLAGGFGSMLADLLSGYLIFAPGTFLIKAGVAMIGGGSYCLLKKKVKNKKGSFLPLLLSSTLGELFMVGGYFLYNIFVISLTNGSFSSASLGSALTQSFVEIPFNIMQGITGVLFVIILLPLLNKRPNNIL